MRKKYSLEYIDSFGESHHMVFHKWEYMNLMEMLWDRSIEDWGDCKGRAWCGTCQVKVIQSNAQLTNYDSEENHCLSKQENRNPCSRLACQLEITESLNGAKLAFLGAT